jgi:multiple sugar transport system substrate-binding protein
MFYAIIKSGVTHFLPIQKEVGMKSKVCKSLLAFFLIILLCIPVISFASGAGEEKAKVTFFWAEYDGLTPEFRQELQDAFNAAHEDMEVDIVPVDWDLMYDKITTAIAGGAPPELCVIGTRWLLEFMDIDAVEEVTKYVSKDTLDNISPGAMEAKLGGKLMGLPVAAGARIMAYNADITKKVPKTMEELRAEAKRLHNPPNVYGLIMPGKKHTELTDFAYYLYAAGGDFFETRPDGSFGKCAINSPAGVKALEFMVQLATKDKVIQEGYLGLDRTDSHPLFYIGKYAYVFIGAWVESAYKQAGGEFDLRYAQIPPFQGQKQTSLIITDSIAIFKDAKNKEAAGKFLDFFYKDEWKARFDEMIGFPPVTISAGKLPQFQTPLYKVLIEAAGGAKGWPLMAEWAEVSSIIWDANVEAFLGRKSPKKALDDAAAKVDKLRGM